MHGKFDGNIFFVIAVICLPYKGCIMKCICSFFTNWDLKCFTIHKYLTIFWKKKIEGLVLYTFTSLCSNFSCTKNQPRSLERLGRNITDVASYIRSWSTMGKNNGKTRNYENDVVNIEEDVLEKYQMNGKNQIH